MITMGEGRKNVDLDAMHNHFFHWTELIQSSPEAILESVKSVIAGGYRRSNVVLHELRFNPMFRNRGGERDLDHIIMSAIWGMQQAILEYPQVKAGLILMMDRMFDVKKNLIIIQKAIKYQKYGIVGVDVAGPERSAFSMKKHLGYFEEAKKAGLGVTVHSGEAGSLKELEFVVDEVHPDRIGHGVLAYKSKSLMGKIAAQKIVLEICPTSNLKNSVIANIKQMKKIYRALFDSGIVLTINTDGPEMYRTNIIKEQEFLLKNKIFNRIEIEKMRKNAFIASFVR